MKRSLTAYESNQSPLDLMENQQPNGDSIPRHRSTKAARREEEDDGNMRINGLRDDAIQTLNEFSIIELINQDLRPVFIVDLHDVDFKQSRALHPVFCNSLLRASRNLNDIISGRPSKTDTVAGAEDVTYDEFKEWVCQTVDTQSRDASLLSYVFKGILWTSSTLASRWRIISGNNHSHPLPKSSSAHTPSFLGYQIAEMPHHFTSQGLDVDGLVELRASLFSLHADWTLSTSSTTMSSHLSFIREIDWASTPIGPMHQWPVQLRQMCNIVMAECTPAIVFWGPEYTMIYNEPYVELLGEKHPFAMGKTPAIVLAEVWEFLSGMLAEGASKCQPIRVEDTLFPLIRHGIVEEAYFSSTFLPLVGADRVVCGFHESVLETTNVVVSERRKRLLEELASRLSEAQTLKDYWAQLSFVFEANVKDIPFASMYSNTESGLPEPARSSGSSTPVACEGFFGGSVRIRGGHIAISEQVDLLDGQSGFAPLMRETIDKKEPMVFRTQDSTLSEELVKDVQSSDDAMPCSGIAICPLGLSDEGSASGLLIVGLNPRRPFDSEYQSFLNSLSEVLESALTSMFRTKRETEERLAKQAQHEEELRLLSEEVKREETRFTHLADVAPIGIWIGHTDGSYAYRNPKWFEMTQYPEKGDSDIPFSFSDLVHDNDKLKMQEVWKMVVSEKKTVTFEVQLKRQWQPPEGSSTRRAGGLESNAWLLATTHPNELFPNGDVRSIVGVMTDISHQKWAEREQGQRMEDALEAKRQQEAFVDMVSHEIRNPLSAILISADGVRDSLSIPKNVVGMIEAVKNDTLEAAQTIVYCAQHQKRIIDDILTLSKLDSDLLIVTPVPVRPVTIAENALSMISSEARNGDITMSLRIDNSYEKLGVGCVLLDPSRLTQVLINLITNAIKFTQGRPKRQITVSSNVSLSRPSHNEIREDQGLTGDMNYIPVQKSQDASVTGDDWGSGETVFINFDVQDTGRGLSADEKKLLFQRFSQATPRTHVQYGGSGLGLFISRKLVEKQGGQIGVKSESGVGSVFSFYVMARRSATEELSTYLPPSITKDKANTFSQAWTSTPPANGLKNEYFESVKLDEPESRVKRNVLVVEDNLVNQKVMSKQLQLHGWNVSVANHGGEALEFLKTTTFWSSPNAQAKELNIVLMDQEMPVMDGLTCIKRIREMEQKGDLTGHVPVIAVTANARVQQIETLTNAGMDDVLLKPFLVNDLITKIENLVKAMS